jgi:hypothetical protein
MALQRFQVDERVRLRIEIDLLGAGSAGTVRRVYRFMDAYDIQFDGYSDVRLIWGRNLERADEEPPAP